jgi:hypothetical protein
LDFVVVVTGWISLTGQSGNLGFLRIFRVMRPLAALSHNPTRQGSTGPLRRLVQALVGALPHLMPVVGFTFMAFVMFAIVSVQLWGKSGAAHGRCRLTKNPIQLSSFDQQQLKLGGALIYNKTSAVDCGKYGVKEAWLQPQPCWWPMDESNPRLCSMGPSVLGDAGHICPPTQTCGSNYDTRGQPRFQSIRIMESDLFVPELNFGYTTYDNVLAAFFVIFQCVTLEGWWAVLNMVSDGVSTPLSVTFFVLVVVFGGFFLMNVFLAAIMDAYSRAEEKQQHLILMKQAHQLFGMMYVCM